jgi:CRISPR type III-A-associated protein Csm2
MSAPLPKDIGGVKTKIEGLGSFSELDPAYYAIEEGAAHIVAKDVKDKEMKTTQLRKFFGHIKKLELETKGKKLTDQFESSKLHLIMPELAYALGRKLISADFYDLMKKSLSSGKIKTVGDFRRFVDFLSAVLAYHKMIGGK